MGTSPTNTSRPDGHSPTSTSKSIRVSCATASFSDNPNIESGATSPEWQANIHPLSTTTDSGLSPCARAYQIRRKSRCSGDQVCDFDPHDAGAHCGGGYQVVAADEGTRITGSR